MRIKIVLLVMLCLLSVSVASAGVTTLGNGFKCSGSSILKGSKTVSYSKAKSTLAATIAKLKQQLKTASKKKKPGIKSKITAANQSKTLLTACFKGLLANQVDPIFTQLASGSGIYSGTYNGNVTPIVGPITGDVTMQFILNGTTVTGILSLGGQLGNALNAKPLSFQNDVGGIGFPAKFVLSNTFLGEVTLSITQAGHLSITNTDQSKPIDFEGDFANQNITCTIAGGYSIFSFNGGAILTRQP